MYILNFIFFR